MTAITADAKIAALSVQGLTVKGIAEIPQEVTYDLCPVLFPNPQGWLSEQVSMPGEFNNAVLVKREHNYSLKYILAYAPAASGRGLADHFAGMAALADAIDLAIYKLDFGGLTSVRRINIGTFGALQDPAGKTFYGCGVEVTFFEIRSNK